MTNLELIIGKGLRAEYLVDMGSLKTKIDIHGLNSQEVESFKDYMSNHYQITRKNIKSNWFIYQSYIRENVK